MAGPPRERYLYHAAVLHGVVGLALAGYALAAVSRLVAGTELLNARPAVTGSAVGAPPSFFGWAFMFSDLFMLGLCAFFACCYGFVAVALTNRRCYLACLIVSYAGLMLVPFGTALGGFTLWVLFDRDVRRRFGVE